MSQNFPVGCPSTAPDPPQISQHKTTRQIPVSQLDVSQIPVSHSVTEAKVNQHKKSVIFAIFPRGKM